MKIPQILFLYTFPFDSGRRALFEKNTELGEYPTVEEVIQETKRVQALWNSINKENKIMLAMLEVIGVNPERDFDFAVFGQGMKAMSNPLLLPTHRNAERLSDAEIIETIIHELLHRFTSGNATFYGKYDTTAYWKFITETYKDEPIMTRNHILVYAALDKILPQVLSEEDIRKEYMGIKNPDYLRAIQIVEEKGSDVLIEEFKKRIK